MFPQRLKAPNWLLPTVLTTTARASRRTFFGKIEILVNDAGVSEFSPFEEVGQGISKEGSRITSRVATENLPYAL